MQIIILCCWMCSSLGPYIHSNYKALYKTILLCHIQPSQTSIYRQHNFVMPILCFNSVCLTLFHLHCLGCSSKSAPVSPFLRQQMYVTTVTSICILIFSEAEGKKEEENIDLIRGGLYEMWQNLSPSHSKENNHKQKVSY